MKPPYTITKKGNVKFMGNWKQSDIDRLQGKQAAIPFEGIPAKKAKKKRSKEEFLLQIACIRWFDFAYPEFREKRMRFHVPNQGFAGGAKTGAFLKRMGKQAGTPDFFILKRKEPFSGLIIDFKAKGGALSDEQRVFFENAAVENFFCEEIDSLDAFIETVENYLGKSKKVNQWIK